MSVGKSTVQLPAASAQVVTGTGVLSGWNFAETGGSAAVIIRLYDSITVPVPGTTPLLAVCHLLASETAGDQMDPGRIYKLGIYAYITGSGTPEGVVDA